MGLYLVLILSLDSLTSQPLALAVTGKSSTRDVC